MFDVMQRVAKASCDYVKRGKRSCFGLNNVGDSSGRTAGGPGAIEEIERELTKVIEDFDRAVNVEALRLVKETGTHAFSQSGDISFSVVQSRATVFA